MVEIKVIDKARGIGEEGALGLLKYHKVLRETKIARLERQLKGTKKELEEIEKEIRRLEEGGVEK